MDTQRAADELKVIRQLMERPIRYSTMSGASAILAGLAALAGAITSQYISQRYPSQTACSANGLVWLGVFCVALVSNIMLTRIRERKHGMPFWSSLKRRILLTIVPPFVMGTGLTLAVAHHEAAIAGVSQWGLIAALWMAFYGLALWQVGEFSKPEVRLLGVAFLLMALPTAGLWQGWPYVALGVAFGGFHIVYGIIVWMRHGG